MKKTTLETLAKSKSFRRELLFKVVIPMFLVICVILIGTLGFAVIEKMPLHEALYVTVVMASGGGYGLTYPLSRAGHIFSIIVVVLGLGIIVYGMGIVVQFVLEGEFLGLRRRKKMEQKMNSMKDHLIICGYGRVGHQIADQLMEQKEPFIVIDMKQDTIRELETKEIPYILGNVSDDALLEKAGIKRAKGLFAAADSDTENVYVTLSAKVLKPNIYVVARAAHKDTENRLVKAGADEVISPYKMAGSKMASLMNQKNGG